MTINGNKVLEVFETVSLAIERAREGKGPTLIEAKTYRWKGHSKSDKNVYRTKEEIKSWKARCPIQSFRQYLITEEGVENDVLENIDTEVKKLIQESVQFAERSPEPSLEAVRRMVYA